LDRLEGYPNKIVCRRDSAVDQTANVVTLTSTKLTT